MTREPRSLVTASTPLYMVKAMHDNWQRVQHNMQRMPCVVLDQAAISAQSVLAGAPCRGNSTSLRSLPAELAAVLTHEFLRHLHDNRVQRDETVQWQAPRHLYVRHCCDSRIHRPACWRSSCDIFQIHVVLFVWEWVWQWFHHDNKAVDYWCVYVILGNSANRMPLRPDVSRPHLGGALERAIRSDRTSTIVWCEEYLCSIKLLVRHVLVSLCGAIALRVIYIDSVQYSNI